MAEAWDGIRIGELHVGVRFHDISGNLAKVVRREKNITWAVFEDGHQDCYANSAEVRPVPPTNPPAKGKTV